MAGSVAGTLTPIAFQSADCQTFCTGSFHPDACQAHEDLVAALEDMHTWEERHLEAKELLKEMLQSRSEAAELSKKYDIRSVPGS